MDRNDLNLTELNLLIFLKKSLKFKQTRIDSRNHDFSSQLHVKQSCTLNVYFTSTKKNYFKNVKTEKMFIKYQSISRIYHDTILHMSIYVVIDNDNILLSIGYYVIFL